MSNVVIIYHNADPDGIFSGAIALKANPDALTIGYNYEKDVDDIIYACRDKDVFMVDVSFSDWNDMHRLCETANDVIWIDHHKSAYLDMDKARTQLLYENFVCVFEHEKWGAAKRTWDYFFPKLPMPDCVRYVAAYDVFMDYGSPTWKNLYFPFRFSSGRLKTPQAVLEVFYLDYFEDWDNTVTFLEKGRAIAEYVDSENEFVVNNPTLCREVDFWAGGRIYKTLAVNKPLVGDMFKSRDLSAYDFVVGYMNHTTEWKVSLRGAGKDIDLGFIAKGFGGGGHKDAAGFSIPTFQMLQKILYI